MRFVPLLLTVILLVGIFHSLNGTVLLQTFSHIHVVWFISAVILYGLLFVPAAWRWHLVLRLTGKDIDFFATWRTSLIGHFFYTVLFGVVGGDSGKAIFYARRNGFASEEILATAPIDRLLGLIGSIVFGALAFAVAAAGGAFGHLNSLTFALPSYTVWICLGVVILFAVLLRSRKFSPLTGFACAFKKNAAALVKAPRALLGGIVCGLLVQAALSGVLALNLWAVSAGPLPWQKLLWTFPIIVAISALPVTVGGLGTREGIATLLWTAYGIPKADAVMASLLTMLVGVIWALIGGLLLRSATREKSATGSQPAWAPATIKPTGSLKAGAARI